MPVRNTTGNSRPLAVCRVISVTTPGSGAGVAVVVPAVVVRDLVGVRDERDALEEVGEDALGVALLELGGDGVQLGQVLHPGAVLRVVARAQLGEVAGAVEHGAEDLGRARRSAASARRSVIIAANADSPVIARVPRPGTSSSRSSAAPNEMRSRSAYDATIASDRSPSPRLGTLRMRRTLTSSSGLSSARR